MFAPIPSPALTPFSKHATKSPAKNSAPLRDARGERFHPTGAALQTVFGVSVNEPDLLTRHSNIKLTKRSSGCGLVIITWLEQFQTAYREARRATF